MESIPLDDAYPGIRFAPSSHNWWAWLKGTPPECVHIDRESIWTASFLPDTLYLRSKKSFPRDVVRPEVSLCRNCLTGAMRAELEEYAGRIVAFAPDPESFSQYFFVGEADFEAAGVAPKVAAAIASRLTQEFGHCTDCGKLGTWLWFSREQVATLDEAERMANAPGEVFCALHGARKLCDTFEEIEEANLLYVNVPYSDAGTYVWI